MHDNRCAIKVGSKVINSDWVIHLTCSITCTSNNYRKNSKYWDMYVRANSVDSDQTALKEQSDQDLHCLPFFLHLL